MQRSYNFDKELGDDQLRQNNSPILSNEDGVFLRECVDYYRSKSVYSELYDKLKVKYGKYITYKRLKECCHEYDININESLKIWYASTHPMIDIIPNQLISKCVHM